MATLPGNESSQREGTAGTDTRRVRMAWFEHGSSRIYFEVQGRGSPILLIPEFGWSIEEFSGLRDSLVIAGYQVIAADLPGCGRSEPQPRQYTASSLEEDALAFAALLQHLVNKPAHLVGFGNGGEICLLMAEIMPEVAQSVVASGAIGRINDPGGELREAIFNVVDHPTPSLQRFREYLVSTYGEEQARVMTQSMVEVMSDIIKAGGELSRSKAEMITCPVLLITGEYDMFAPPALICELTTAMHDAEMLVAQSAQHFLFLDCSEWLMQTILEWMRKL